MAVGGNVGEFDIWLNNKLLAFNTDEGVFGSYIKGILEGEETLDEKTQALEEILSEITEDNISKLCQEILEKWKIFQAEEESSHKSVLEVAEDVDVKLARLMESQAKATTVTRSNYTAEEKRIREAILSQYGQMSDEEGEAVDDGGGDKKEFVKENSLVKNTNASSVQQAEREKREKAKIDSQKKKEKDKEDREKQKQLAQEKKEKRKTQKGERRR